MQFIFDHLIAVLVSMVLAVALIAQQTHVRQETLERQSVYDAKVKALAFAEWIEDDVAVLGSRFGRSRERFVDSTAVIGGHPVTTSFEFYHYERQLDDETVQRVEIRYAVVSDGRLLAGRDAEGEAIHVPLYRLMRFRRAGPWRLEPGTLGAWVGAEPAWSLPEGYASPRGLSRFLIEPLDSDGQAVTDPAEADYLRLHFAVVPTLFPLERARLVPASGLFWSTTIEIRPF